MTIGTPRRHQLCRRGVSSYDCYLSKCTTKKCLSLICTTPSLILQFYNSDVTFPSCIAGCQIYPHTSILGTIFNAINNVCFIISDVYKTLLHCMDVSGSCNSLVRIHIITISLFPEVPIICKLNYIIMTILQEKSINVSSLHQC